MSHHSIHRRQSSQRISRPHPLLKYRSQGSTLSSAKSKTKIYAFPPARDDGTVRSSIHSSDIATTFSRMLLHVEGIRSFMHAFSANGVIRASRPFHTTVKRLVKQLNKFPDDFRPSVAFDTAQYGALVAVDTFICFIKHIPLCQSNLGWSLKRAEDRLDMCVVTIHSLLQLAVHELEECNRKWEESQRSSKSVPLMSAEQEAAHWFDETARPFSYFIDKMTDTPAPVSNQEQKPPARKNSLLNALRKISNLALRRSDSVAAISKEDHTIHLTHLAPLRSHCKGNLMLENIRHSIVNMPKPMRDSMAPFIFPSAPHAVEPPDTEYLQDNSLHKANIQGLVSVITSSSGAENSAFVAMVLMTFRLFTTPKKFAETLLHRYKEKAPVGLSHDQMYTWTEVSDRVKQRVVVILHQWLDQNWKPDDREALDALFYLVEQYIAENSEPDSVALLESLTAIRDDLDYEGSRYLSADCPVPTTAPVPLTRFGLRAVHEDKPLDPKVSNIFHFASPDGIEEFARQLTMAESLYYHRTCPDDFVHYDEGNPGRKGWTAFDDNMTYWVVDCVVSPETPRERAKVFEFWVFVSRKCADMRNYSSAYTIYSALHQDVVTNLTCTTREITIKCIKVFRSLVELFSLENWWKEMTSSTLPAIPVGSIIIRWRHLIQETGAKHLGRRLFTHKQVMGQWISKDRIDVDAFLNLADFIWEMEYTYAAHNYPVIPWMQQFITKSIMCDRYYFGFQSLKAKEGTEKESPYVGTFSSWEAIFDRVRHRRIKPMPLEEPAKTAPVPNGKDLPMIY